MRGLGCPPWHLANMRVSVSYHVHQDYKWFMGGDLEHFQDNLQTV